MRAAGRTAYARGMNDGIGLRAQLSPQIVVEAARAVVRLDGAPLRLTAREREIVVLLAVADRPLTVRDVGLALNPDSDDANAANAAKVYVHRIRRRAGAAAIVRRDGGYLLGPGVVRDVTEARRALASHSGAPGPIGADERDRLLEIAASLRTEPPAALAVREWFTPVGPSLRRLGHDLAMLIGRAALVHGDAGIALSIARDLTFEDACDEEAWELLFTAQVRVGQTAAAVQGLRFYESSLARELGEAPSPRLRAMVDRCAIYAEFADVRRSQNGRSRQRLTAS